VGVVIDFDGTDRGSVLFAGWFFRQLAQDVLERNSADAELKQIFENAEIYNDLAINQMSPDIADKVTREIRIAAEDILSGKVQSGIIKQPFGNEDTQQMYKEGLRKLLYAASHEHVNRGAS
jgi:hypothetical protein